MGRQTYGTSSLHFRTANLEIWQARYTWVFFQFCVDGYETFDCTRTSTARGALDLRGTVGFFVSAENVTGLNEENSEFAYSFFPLLRVGSDGAAKDD